MDVNYSDTRSLTPVQYADLLVWSSRAERRPVRDLARIAAMIGHANLLCTAWAGDRLVGVARALTDFAFCCYVADLAVDRAYQHQGIGVELMRRTQARLHPEATVVLLAAPQAREYYPKIGMVQHPSAWIAPAMPLLPPRPARAPAASS